MKRRSSAFRYLILVFLLLTTHVIAKENSALCGDKLTDSEDAAFKAMTDNSYADTRCFTMEPWPAAPDPGLFVAAMGSDPTEFDVDILKAKGNGWEVIGFNSPDNDPGLEPADANVLEDLSLDVIPYHISDSEVAFGVRVSTSYTSTSILVTNTSLHLFRFHDQRLDEIFAASVESSETDKTLKGGDADTPDTLIQSVLYFTSTKHGGHYDIVLKPVKVKGSKAKIQHYIWKNGQYVSGDSPKTGSE